MSLFAPRLDILPPPQRRLWPALAEAPAHFVLYGGTALALRLGHRASEDFDFFSAVGFRPDELLRQLRFAERAEVTQTAPNTLTFRTAAPNEVKCSFFGGLRLRQLEPPSRASDTGLRVASLRDLMAVKLNTLAQRAEAKDYLDVHALLRAGCSLAEGLAWARAVHGGEFNPALPLKALTYFEDGDLPTLPVEIKQDLRAAVRAVTEVPDLPLNVSPLGAET